MEAKFIDYFEGIFSSTDLGDVDMSRILQNVQSSVTKAMNAKLVAPL